jgi:hypothetical protein
MSQNRWTIPLDRLAAKSSAKLETVVRAVTLQLFVSVVRRSPVDTGRFRSNWNISYGSPDITVTQLASQTRGMQQANQAMQQPVGGIVYLSNGLAYAGKLENGWSKQAPYGMVKLAASELASAVRKATA